MPASQQQGPERRSVSCPEYMLQWVLQGSGRGEGGGGGGRLVEGIDDERVRCQLHNRRVLRDDPYRAQTICCNGYCKGREEERGGGGGGGRLVEGIDDERVRCQLHNSRVLEKIWVVPRIHTAMGSARLGERKGGGGGGTRKRAMTMSVSDASFTTAGSWEKMRGMEDLQLKMSSIMPMPVASPICSTRTSTSLATALLPCT